MGISYSSTGSTLKIRFRYKGGNLETVWIAYWKGGYLAKIPREGGTWKSGIPKGGNLAFSLLGQFPGSPLFFSVSRFPPICSRSPLGPTANFQLPPSQYHYVPIPPLFSTPSFQVPPFFRYPSFQGCIHSTENTYLLLQNPLVKLVSVGLLWTCTNWRCFPI